MAMGTERSKPLHNFTMPCDLRWGNQKHLRCMRVDSGGRASTLNRITASNLGSSDRQQRRGAGERDRELSSEFVHGSPAVGSTPGQQRYGGRRRAGEEEDGDGIAAMREKVMLDLQTAAEKMKVAILKDGFEERGSSPPPASAYEEAHRPWSLRTRRSTFKMPLIPGRIASSPGEGSSLTGAFAAGKGPTVDTPLTHSGFSHWRPTPAVGDSDAASGDRKVRAKLTVALSKREIEEDFFAMVGHRPPRRPKKRTKFVQKSLDDLSPGLGLTEVTADKYKVPVPATAP